MDAVEILRTFGIPALLSGAFLRYIQKSRSDAKALKLGVQAVLRSQMIAEYNKWQEKGYAPIYARENFENCWKHYHSLGANGVMDDIHEKFLEFPVEEPEVDRDDG